LMPAKEKEQVTMVRKMMLGNKFMSDFLS
jgi:hypothetical protein